MAILGRNINIPLVTSSTVQINSLNAVTLLAPNAKRLWAYVSFDFYTGVDQQLMIREFAATVSPNLKRGYLMSRVTSGNNAIHNLIYRTVVDNPYQGEISAISLAGTFNLHVVEGYYI